MNKIHSIKKILFIFLVFTLFCCEDVHKDAESRRLIINEFLAMNSTCCPDENGEYDDWVEIFNGDNTPISVGGMYFTDRRDDPNPYKIPNIDTSITTIPAGGFLVLWCDKNTDQGILHLDLKLSGVGESVVLIDIDGTTILDYYTFDIQTADISMGRSDDNWIFFENPTPGTSNE